MTAYTTWIAAALTFGLSCASAPALLLVPASEHPSKGTLFPPATSPLTLSVASDSEAGEGQRPSMLSLVESYGAVTSQHVLMTEAVREQLRALPCGFQSSLIMPVGAVQSMTEHMLSANGFILYIRRNQEPFMVEVLNTMHQVHFDKALSMSPESILTDTDHPAVLVSTVMTLATVDPRTVANVMRSITGNQTDRMISLSGRAINLIGPMPTVAGWLRTLWAVEQASADSSPEVVAPAEIICTRFPLKHASADEAYHQLRTLFHAERGKNHQGFVAVADSRTNAVLINCDQDLVKAVEEAVALIDTDV